MNSYLSLVPKYLAQHQKQTRLVIVSVAISVALITGIFSMLDVFLRFERIQVLHDQGNYHLVLKNASTKEMDAISSRIDVAEAGRWVNLGKGSINGIECLLGALDENFADNLNVKVIAGRYPTAHNEVMLEQWAAESRPLNLKVNDTVKITVDGVPREFTVSGIYNDLSNLKAQAVPGLILSVDRAVELRPDAEVYYAVLFKDGVKVLNAEKEIKETLNLADDRVQRNEPLLAVTGQSRSKHAVSLYATGAVLFVLVLMAGVLMIYNTFNISVMERVRQFGLLRCIGASQSQIKKLVRREGLIITLKAIPIGVLAGMLVTFFCSALLKFYNSSLFQDIPLFTVSIPGISAGIAIGFLTVFAASLLPARKAAQVSPVNAVTGASDIAIPARYKRRLLTRILQVEIALGIGNAVMKKRTFVLMASSIAVSIIMFMGFQVFVDFMHTSLRTTKPYTPDISLSSEQGMGDEIYARLSGIEGVKRVYGRMFSYVDATFDANRLTDTYKNIVNDVEVAENGFFIPPEKSWLISYERNQFHWSKPDLIEGTLDQDKLNDQNGVIVVVRHIRKNISIETVNWRLGDRVYVDTPTGRRELRVMGILRTVPFRSEKPTLTTFITTEKLFTELTGESAYKAVDIQLAGRNQEQAVQAIKELAGEDITFHDERQRNAEIDQTFFTMAVFVYGFIAVIALISILNIINTMNTSVASKTRYLGVMRAVGMSGTQLDRMVLTEAAVYSLTGCLAGCILGIMLQKALVNQLLSTYHIIWRFPLTQIILIFICTVIITVVSVTGPLKRLKDKGISELVSSL
ncbi:MAG: ABC transporter permease [Bacillota bacterium]